MPIVSDPNWRLAYTRHFVERLGFKLGLDFDNALIIEHPNAVPIEAVIELLTKCQASLIAEIKCDAARERRQYVGGPVNGQKIGLSHSHWLTVHVGRGRWAAYYSPLPYRDGRAFYVGEATNQRKARLLAAHDGPKLFPAGDPR